MSCWISASGIAPDAISQARRVATTLGADVVLVEVRCPAGTRRDRFVRRSASDDGTCLIDDARFDWIAVAHRRLDPLDPDEARPTVDTA